MRLPSVWQAPLLLAYLGLLTAGICVPTFAENAPNDPHYSKEGSWGQTYADQWALQQQRVYTDIAPAPAQQDVIVAIIDTGLDYTHEDLAADRLWRNPAETKNGRDDDGNGYVDDLIGWNYVDHNNNPWDLSGHGTHIAGLIAACTNNGIGIAGINPDARIMPLKVANFAGQARSSSVAAAIHYAVEQGARIINLSLAGETITELEIQAAEFARQRGVLIVVAAGNRGIGVDRFGYAALPGVLVVGASTHDGNRAGFSNFGAQLSLLAPGVEILSLRARDTDFIALSQPLDYASEDAVVGEGEHYYRASGTSFSAAIATGIASRVLARQPELSGAQLRQLLIQSAADIAPPGVDQLSGYGGLDYIAALSTRPGQYVQARLNTASLELIDTQLWVNILGQAQGDEFASAALQFRPAAGSIPIVEETGRKKKKKKKKRDAEPADPYQWQTLASFDNVVDGQLGRFEVNTLTRQANGSTQWDLKLVVTTTTGVEREARMSLHLPVPDAAEVSDES